MPRGFAWLWVGTFVNRLGTFVTPFLALYLTVDRGLSLEEAGAIVSLVGLGSIASGPAGGALADRVGRRFTLGAASVLGAASMLALGLARGTAQIAVAALLLGFFGELYRPAVSAIVADLVPPADRPRAYGLLHWAVNLGFSVAPILAGFLATKSYALLFLGDAATTLAFGALVVARVGETRPQRDAKSDAVRPSLLAPYKDGVFLAFVALSLLLSIVYYQGHVAFPAHLARRGFAPQIYGALLGINGALVVVFQPIASSRLARASRTRVLAASALLTGVGWGMTELGGAHVAIYAASVAVWTAGEIAMAPMAPTVIADLAPPALRATYQGAYQITFGGASFLAPMAGGLLMARAGSAALWGACALAGVLTACGFLLVVPRAEARAGPEA